MSLTCWAPGDMCWLIGELRGVLVFRGCPVFASVAFGCEVKKLLNRCDPGDICGDAEPDLDPAGVPLPFPVDDG